MARKLFGTDGVRGRANDAPMTAGDGAPARPGRRALLHQRRPRPPGRDRQGHPPLGLHARDRAGRRLHLGRHGRLPGRPDADPGGRLPHPLDARRLGRDDLRLAQPVRGQRHQVLRPRRLQAPRRRRGGDRGAARGRPRRSPSRAASAAPPASTTPAAATSCSSRPPSRAASASTASRSWSTAPTAPPTAPRPRCSGSSAPRSIPIGVAPDGFNINRELRLDPHRRRRRRGARPRRRPRHQPRRRRRPGDHHRRDRRRRRRRPGHGADRRPLGRARAGSPSGTLVATVMSNLGLERHLARPGPDAPAHRRRRPLRRRGDARGRLQPRRRAVRPHRDDRLRHHRRRPDRRAAVPLGDGRDRPAAPASSPASSRPSRRC